MAEIEKLFVTLEAKVSNYEKALAKANATTAKQMAAIEGRFTKANAKFATFGVGAFGGLAKGAAATLLPLLSAGAAIRGAKAALAEFGDVADNAKAAGLDAEFFQGIAHQAQLGGVGIEQISGALATFAKNAGLAAEGKGRMTTALKALDPVLLENIRNAATQEQRIKLIADALSKETDAARKAAIATAAFGDAGLKLAGVFAGGAAQIEVMQVKARELGLIVDRDLIARADELGDEFDTTRRIVELQLQTALVNLGPTLIWLTGLAGGLASQIGQTVDGLNAIENQSSRTLETRLKGIDTQLLGADGPNPSVAAIDPAAAASEQAAILTELRRRAIAKLAADLSNRPPSGADIPSLEEEASRNAAAAAAVRQGEAVKNLIAQLEFEKSLIGVSATDQAVATALREAGATATDGQRAQIESLVRTMGAERAAIEANTEAMEAFGAAAQSAMGTFIADLIEGKSLTDSLGGILKGLGGQLINAGLGGLFGGGGGILGGLFGLPGRANGGSVRAGQPYIVGERRPELFIPSQSGTIVPRVPTMSSAANDNGPSVAVHISIDATGADAAGLARVQGQLAQLKAELPSTIKQTIKGRGRTWR